MGPEQAKHVLKMHVCGHLGEHGEQAITRLASAQSCDRLITTGMSGALVPQLQGPRSMEALTLLARLGKQSMAMPAPGAGWRSGLFHRPLCLQLGWHSPLNPMHVAWSWRMEQHGKTIWSEWLSITAMAALEMSCVFLRSCFVESTLLLGPRDPTCLPNC